MVSQKGWIVCGAAAEDNCRCCFNLGIHKRVLWPARATRLSGEAESERQIAAELMTQKGGT